MTILKKTLILTIIFLTIIIGQVYISDIHIDAPPDKPKYIHTANKISAKYHPILRLHIKDTFCTGVVISDNYALTADHCLKNSVGLSNKDPFDIIDGEQLSPIVTGELVAADSLRDIAIVQGDFTAFRHYKVDFHGEIIQKNMEVTSCGFPSGQDRIHCTSLTLTGNKYFQYRAKGLPIFKGMSGGPVFDKKTGTVIGVNSAVDNDTIIISPTLGFLESVGL